MLLETNLPTNTNGKVPGSAPDGTIYWFEKNADGELVCDVPNDNHVSFFLGTGQFYPSDKEDFAEAASALKAEREAEPEVDPEPENDQVEHEKDIHAKRGRPKKVI